MANRLNVEMNLDLTPFEKALGRLQSRLNDLSRRMQQTGETLSQNLTLPILGVGAAAVKAFGDMERLENGLTAIMGSSEAAKAELERLRKVAENPGLALPEVVKASASLQSVGFSANNARATIEQFGNAVARSAGNAETFDGVILALSQISAVGQVTQEDLNQIKERIPEFSRVMQQEFGVTTAEAIRELGISSNEFIERSVGALSKLERAKGGISNAFDNFKDNVTASLAVLGESIATNLNLEQVLTNLSNTLARIVNVFKNLSPAMQKTVVIFAAILAAIGPVLFIVGKLTGAWGVMLTGFDTFRKLGPKIGAAWTAITGPVGLTIAAIAGLIAILAILYTKFEGVRRVINGLGMAFIEIAKLAKESFTAILEGFAKLKEGDFKGAAQSFATGLKAFNPIEQGRVAALGFAKGFEDTTDYLTPAIEGIKKKVKEAQAAFTGVTTTQFTPTDFTPTGGGGGGKGKAKSKAVPELDFIQTLDLLPRELDNLNKQLGITQSSFDVLGIKVTTNTNAALTSFGERMKLIKEQMRQLNDQIVQVVNTTLVDAAAAFGTFLGDSLLGKKATGRLFLADLLGGIASALQQLGKLAIAIGIAVEGIKKALQTLNPIAAIAGGVALIALSKIVSAQAGKLTAFAQGGLVFGPTPALVGDNPGARTDPEVIAPLSKLKDYLNPAGGAFVAEARISGTDLLILVNNADRANKRVR